MRNAGKLTHSAGMALALIIAGFLSVPAAQAANVSLLVEDFSGIDAYTRDQLQNPFHAAAGNPKWLNPADPYWLTQPLGTIGFHTNNLGYYTSGFNDGQGVNNFVNYGINFGAMHFTWDSRPYDVYWYSALSVTAGGIAVATDLTPYKFLKIRVRGGVGGETFRIRIDTAAGDFPDRVVRISDYATLKPDNDLASDWQTVTIPLAAFDLPSQQAKAVVLLFDPPRPGRSTETVSIDDILFEQDPNYRPVSDGVVKPASSHSVRVINRQLYVSGKPLTLQGVGYSPTRIGETPDFGTYQPFTQAVVQRDFPNLQTMGANSVRVWQRFDYEQFDHGNAIMDRTYTNNALMQFGSTPSGIKVCAGFWVPYEISMANEWAKARLKENFTQFVTSRKAEPGLLMWVIGNENNVQNGYDWRWYQFANDLAKTAYLLERPAYHPAAIVEADLGTIGVADLASDNARLNYFDVLGVNAYRGKDWDGFFNDAWIKTAKAIWISEYGIDAWKTNDPNNPSNGSLDQAAQADYDVKMWLEFFRNRAKTIGASVLEYSDEWWKFRKSPPNEVGGRLFVHDYNGFNFSVLNPVALPDGYMNEEWWGLMEVLQNASGVDEVRPRQVFYQLYSPTIGGRVRNDAGQPVPGVTMEVWGFAAKVRTVVTDNYGLYAVPELPLGSYTVKMLQNGAAAKQSTVVLSATARTVLADFVYSPRRIVSALSATPAAVLPGGTLSVSNSIKNQSTTAATALNVTFSLSRDAYAGGADDLPLTGSRALASLGAGLTSAAVTPVTVPASTPYGSYYLCGQVGGAEAESGNTARCAATLFKVTRPDLIVADVRTTTVSVTAGLAIAVTDTAKNVGGLPSTAATVGYRFSTNRIVGDADDVSAVATRALPALAAGASNALAVSVKVPGTIAPGRYFICASVDTAGVVTEMDENNNAGCTTVPIKVVKSNLTVTSVSTMAKVVKLGAAFSVTDTVQNNGATTSSAATMKYYLSRNASLGDADDVLLTGSRAVPALAPNGAHTGTASVTVPLATPPGFDYYVCALADGGGTVFESNENDNARCSATTVSITAVDLAVTAIKFYRNGWSETLENEVIPVAGEIVTAKAVLTNAGTAQTPGFAIDWKLDNGQVYTGNHAPLQAAQVSQDNVRFNWAATAGAHTLKFTADGNNALPEYNELNNAFSRTVTVLQPSDLAVTAFTTSLTSVARGGVITVTDTTRNGAAAGSATAVNFRVAYYLSTDANVTPGDPLLPTVRSIAALAPGGASTLAVNETIPTSVAPGTYYVCAQADPKVTVFEANEGNNVRCTAAPITVR